MDIIEVTVNRKKRNLPVNSIRYIEVMDKLTVFHLKTGENTSIFMPISEIERDLPEDRFIRVSRSYIVAYEVIHSIDEVIYLLDGEKIPYSTRRKSALISGYRQYMEKVLLMGKKNTGLNHHNFEAEYKCFDMAPIAFAVIELVLNSDRKSIDFIFRYANKALAIQQGVLLKDMCGKFFYKDIFPEGDEKWLEYYAIIAFEGGYKEIYDYSPEIDKHLRIQCFQPYYGYCACLFTDMEKMFETDGQWNFTEKGLEGI